MESDKDRDNVLSLLMILVVAVFFLPLGVVYTQKKQNNKSLYPADKLKRFLIALMFISPVFLLNYLVMSKNWLNILVLISILWSFGYGLACLLVPLILGEQVNEIKLNHLTAHKNPTMPELNMIGPFCGKSMLTKKNLFIEDKNRVMHSLVVGSTGSGKTTLMESFFSYDVKRGRPVFIIDPKGNDKTINRFKELAKKSGLSSEKFKVFNLAKPFESVSYNPLKNGSPVQIKDRLMSSLQWSEQYYSNIANVFLLNTIEVFFALKITTTLDEIVKLIEGGKSSINTLKEKISISDLTSEFKSEIEQNVTNIAKIDPKDLANLASQLKALSPKEFDYILSPKGNKPELDLSFAIQDAQVVYFALPTMNYSETAPVVGKLLLQDLKAITSNIQTGNFFLKDKSGAFILDDSGKKVKYTENMISVFVDEFGSFAFDSFIDWIKMARDAGLAIHLFFQSLADLNKISPDFKNQISSNCVNKFVLRTDEPEEVEFWASVAGTQETIEQSYQVEGTFMQLRTGAGNQRESSKMVVPHDVIKRLSAFQAILIQKNPYRVDLVNLYAEFLEKK